MALLTYHGQILGIGAQGGALTLTPVADWADGLTAAAVALEEESLGRGKFESFLMDRTAPVKGRAVQPELEPFEIVFDPVTHTVTLQQDGRYLCPHPPAAGGGLACDASEAKEWERYLLLPERDLRTLLFILSNDWVHDGKVVRREQITLLDGFRLRIGDLEADLRLHLPFTGRGGAPGDAPFSLVMYRDGWRITEIFLYRPLMFFTAFKSPDVLAQLTLSLRSLVTFGGYDGHIHVITDQDHESLLEQVPELDPAKLTVQFLDPQDWVGFVASKYCICDHTPAWTHQPLVFNDPDITFDAPVTPMLAAVASQGRIAAPAEPFSPLRSSVANGATLLQRDDRDPRFAIGFNAGTLAFSNLETHGPSLEAVRHVLVNHARLHGRSYHRWVDQETANYVLYCLGVADTHLMNQFVRFGWPGTEDSDAGRRGLTHFWPSHTKRNTMQHYEKTLQASGL